MMTSDADCTRAGWRQYYAEWGSAVYHLSVAPDADLDGAVQAWDHDDQRMRLVYGWMASWQEIPND